MLLRSQKRLIRKDPLWSRIQAYPFDLFLWANEYIMSTSWDDKSLGMYLTGYGLSALYLVALVVNNSLQSSNKRRENPLFQTNQINYGRIRARANGGDPFNVSKSRFGYDSHSSVFLNLARVVLFLLPILSIVNVVYLFTSYKNYTLMYADISTKPNTPSINKTTVTNDVSEKSVWSKLIKMLYRQASRRRSKEEEAEAMADYDDTDVTEEPGQFYNPGGQSDKVGTNDTGTEVFSDSDSESDYNDTTIDEINLVKRDMWELTVWIPSKFNLAALSSCSPVILLFLYLVVNELTYWKIVLIAVSINVIISSVVYRFLVLLQDRQLLYKEMFAEYTKKYVKPMSSVLKREVMIDATLGPQAPTEITVQTESRAHLLTGKSKVFITHDIQGKSYNEMSIAQRRKLRSREFNNMDMSYGPDTDESVRYTPRLASNYLNLSHQQYQQPLESPFKSPEGRNGRDTRSARDSSIYTQSTPYRRDSTRRFQDTSLVYEPNYQQRIPSPQRISSPQRRSSPQRMSTPHRMSSPQRIPSPQRVGRDFQSPQPGYTRPTQRTPIQRTPGQRTILQRTPLSSRRPSIPQIPRSPSPTKRSIM
ncbi:hypothetical protein CAAN3_06S07140 [[Candida] anglica]